MARLFGENDIRQLAEKQTIPEFETKITLVEAWRTDAESGTLFKDNETAREQAYNQDFFVKILGYAEKPHSPFSLEPKASAFGGLTPDARLGHFPSDSEKHRMSAVVELKGASVSLDKPQKGPGSLTPVQQGFQYKTLYRDCPFVVVSNFWEFRLYNDTQLDFETWTLAELANPAKNYLNFRTFYFLLNAANFTSPSGMSKTQSLLSNFRGKQERIGRDFFSQYRDARLELLREIYRRNEVVRRDIDLGIQLTQKIVDRVIFACFAEDRGLIPDNTLDQVVSASKSSMSSFWTDLKGFFESIDKGSEKLGVPGGYNGGLFAEDVTLNSLDVPDKELLAVLALRAYNFE